MTNTPIPANAPRPAQYRIDVSRGIVHLLGPTGSDAAAFEQLVHGVLLDPAYRTGFGFLRDRRGMAAPKAYLVGQAVDFLRHLGPLQRSRWAIVVDTPANFGMARMAALLADGSPHVIEIFDAVEKAEEWLRSTWNVLRSER